MSSSDETCTKSFYTPCTSYSKCACARLCDDIFCISHILDGNLKKIGFSKIKLHLYSLNWRSPNIRKELEEKYDELNVRLKTICETCTVCNTILVEGCLKNEKNVRDPRIREEVMARLGRTIFQPPVLRKPSRFNGYVPTLRSVLYFDHLCTADCVCAPIMERHMELDRQHDENMKRLDMERRHIYDSEVAVRNQKWAAYTRLINVCHSCPTCRESLVQSEFEIRQADIRYRKLHGIYVADGTECCTLTCTCGPHLAKLMANDVYIKRLNTFESLRETDIKRNREAIIAEICETCATCAECAKSREPVRESSGSA